MRDFAPRQSYDFEAAIRDVNTACAGLFTPTRASPRSSGEDSSAPAAVPQPPAPAAGAAAVRAPASCPHCFDSADCSHVDICNALEALYSDDGDVSPAARRIMEGGR